MFGSLFLHGNSETQIKYSHWRGNASDMGGGGGSAPSPVLQPATNIMNKLIFSYAVAYDHYCIIVLWKCQKEKMVEKRYLKINSLPSNN